MKGTKPTGSRDSVHNTRQILRIKWIASVVLGTTDLTLFKERVFVLYGVSTFLYSFGYGIPFLLVPDMAELNGRCEL